MDKLYETIASVKLLVVTTFKIWKNIYLKIRITTFKVSLDSHISPWHDKLTNGRTGYHTKDPKQYLEVLMAT